MSRKWVSVSSSHHKWMRDNGHVKKNVRSYDDVVGDLITFFEKHGGVMRTP